MLLDDSLPFELGEELVIDVLINPCRMHDIYINNIICLILDILGTDNIA